MKHPTLAPLKSTALTGYHYDAPTEVLHLGFTSGDVWRYPNVSKDKADGLAKATSAGAYFHANIRGQHLGNKVS